MAVPFGQLPIEERLSLVRRGTAFYLGNLAQIPNEKFRESTGLEGWDIAHLAAHVGYNARALVNLMRWASTGVETPMYPSQDARTKEIELGATLPAGAIRSLNDFFCHQLDKMWEEATEEAWGAEVRTAQGRTVPAEETLWMRAREVWVHAVDLGAGATFSHMPEEFLSALIPDIVGKWRSNKLGSDLVLALPDGSQQYVVDPDSPTKKIIVGSLPGLARWASGRGAIGIETASGEPIPAPPRWL